MPSNPIGTIILGAGASSRMGEPKQLLKWQGETLVQRAIRQAEALQLGPVVLVLGANADLIEAQLVKGRYAVAHNEGWASGMGSSIACGLQALLHSSNPLAGVLITLVDQPLIETANLQSLIKKFKKNNSPIVAAYYGDTLGVPALFSADLFSELLTLSGQKGAKAIISKYSESLAKLDLPAAKLDLDTPEEWQSFLQRKNFGNY
ncbi:MAG: nucleotidyltransferase family protein [Saprospiraceae bacterium]|nr:nucleotidyltransferase family protein [Saprospiraceae bacterium]